MRFSETLNGYMTRLSCTGKELCALSGISEATLSRYRSGDRLPSFGSEPFEKLCAAIARLAEQKGLPDASAQQVRETFAACDDLPTVDRELLRRNFSALLSALDVNIKRLCKYTNYDPSTIFRIRSGARNPSDPEQFAGAIASFVSRELTSPQDMAALSGLLACGEEELHDTSVRYAMLRAWLLSPQAQPAGQDSVGAFLAKLNEFDLNAYIRAIHFDELKVPSMPFQLPTAKTCTGLREMMDSELDFLKATVLSKSMAPVTMYSDMPMAEIAKDPDFPKKWMFGMAMMLKKGLHLNQIHNLDRSFDEMMLGLESWIPMYMTGQISPYYLKGVQNNVFLHFLKVSGAAALSGEAIAGYHSEGRYYLTKAKREVAYYQKRADALLASACPLMDIYRSDREAELTAFLQSDAARPGRRRGILSTLPLYTISEDLLSGILARAQVPPQQRQTILAHAAAQCDRVLRILQTEPIEDELPDLTEAEFQAAPPVLELSGVFCETDIPYRWEEYQAHLRQTEAFAALPNYTLKRTTSQTFRNLQIFIREGAWAMVSKGKAPAIHFVIRHPKLRAAIESFIPPVTEP